MINKATIEEIRKELSNYSIPIIKRLAKLYYFKNVDSAKHQKWIEKIYEFVHIVPMREDTNMYPTKYDIFGCLLSAETQSNLKSILEEYFRDCSTRGYKEVVLTDSNVANFKIYCRTYLEKLAEELSTKGFITIDFVREKLGGK